MSQEIRSNVSFDDPGLPAISTAVLVATVVFFYLLFGHAGLLLSLPQGYVTAFFPSAGVALAAILLWGRRAWPGVFFGAWLLNGGLVWSMPGLFSWSVFLAVGAMAAAATLQALVAFFLIRRFVVHPLILVDERDILGFFLLGGPLSCLISAILAPLALWQADLIRIDDVWIVGSYGWVGNVLGVLLVVIPVYGLCLSGSLWQARRLSVVFPLVILTAGCLFLFVHVSHQEDRRVFVTFENHSGQLAHTLKANFDSYLQHLVAIERLYSSSNYVDKEEFSTFTQTIFDDFPGIHALEWIPRIRDAQRETFEAQITQTIFPGFFIKERDRQGALVIAARRAEYFPVLYAEPLAGNIQAIGFDLASSPTRKVALNQARDSGQMVATAKITLVQEKGDSDGFLVVYPIYQSGVRPKSVEERRAQLLGFALGVFQMGEVVEAGLAGIDRDQMAVHILDESAPTGSQHLLEIGWHAEDRYPLFLSLPLEMASRQWALHFFGDAAYVAQHHTRFPWLVLTTSLLITALLGIFLLVLTGRTVHVEALVGERTAQLRDRESQMAAILKSAVDPILTIDEFGQIETVNEATVRLFGYAETEMIGHNVRMLMPSPHQENHDLYLQRYRESGIARIIGMSRAVEGRKKDGALIPLRLSVSDVTLADRRIFTGILHDQTEQKKADRLKKEFVSTVSHELRTPLTSIQGALGLIKGGVAGELPAKAKTLIDIAHRNSDRLLRLINDILDIEKIEAGKMAFHPKPQRLSPLIHQAMEASEAYAKGHEVAFVLVRDLPDVQVMVDGDRLAQVLANLLSNAAKFSPSGGQVELSMDREQQRGKVRVAVRDYGEGIPEAFRGRIFQKFSQADSGDTRQTGGTGLGLSICQSILDRMEGEIGFDTVVGVGTTFFFTLPEVVS